MRMPSHTGIRNNERDGAVTKLSLNNKEINYPRPHPLTEYSLALRRVILKQRDKHYISERIARHYLLDKFQQAQILIRQRIHSLLRNQIPFKEKFIIKHIILQCNSSTATEFSSINSSKTNVNLFTH